MSNITSRTASRAEDCQAHHENTRRARKARKKRRNLSVGIFHGPNLIYNIASQTPATAADGKSRVHKVLRRKKNLDLGHLIQCEVSNEAKKRHFEVGIHCAYRLAKHE